MQCVATMRCRDSRGRTPGCVGPAALRMHCLAPACFVFSMLWASAREVYVDPVRGDDTRDGRRPATAVRTLKTGVGRCRPGDTLHILPPPEPIPETLHVAGRGGEPGRPIIIDGGGAVLTGLRPIPADKWQRRGPGLWFFPNRMRRGSLRPFLVDKQGRRIPESPAHTEEPPPGTARWDESGVLFHCEPGRSIGDYGLCGTLAAAGVQISSANYIRITDLTCEYFANDGFNVHGSCYGLQFERVEARFNGDDGFSVHEDVGVVVSGGWFHDNSYGIQDVNASRSMYSGVLVEGNRLHGINFVGGFHSVVDSLVRNNGLDQIRVDRGAAAHIGMGPGDPMLETTAYVCDCVIEGGRNGVAVTRGARLAVRFSLIRGCETGVLAAAGGELVLFGAAVVGCRKYAMWADSVHVLADANLYFPGRIRWRGKVYPPESFATYQAAAGVDEHSLVQKPRFAAEGGYRMTGPVLMHLPVGAVRPGVRRVPEAYRSAGGAE